ncbi:MAG TPA: EF-P lysine aminoacylase EpmA, partial [Kofleriaceae bacterium]|nr:EF-P lysine aminoacylase EpmA [Kofleriaceae bacterium]
MIRRGRVLAIEDGLAILRGEHGDARVPADPAWRPGDLVELAGEGAPRRVRAYAGPPYPGPGTEVARLPRARMDRLHARARALAALRAFFDGGGFLEVETPLLVPSPGLEIHLDAVPAGGGYLITSPEYQMKRLLAGGFERIYQVCRCFRGNERGPHHAGEFTMIEWYRAHAELDAIAADVEALVAHVCRAVSGRAVARVPAGEGAGAAAHAAGAGGGAAGSGGGAAVREIDVTPPWPRLTVRDAMRRWAEVEIAGDEPAAALAAAVRAAGIDVAPDAAWDDAFFAAFLARVEPAIAALDRPLILEDWPAPLAALARRTDADPRIAHRFEAYVGGLELANAFGELTDPVEQRARFEDDLRIRAARGKPCYPIDERLLASLAEGLPPSAGVALGFDRLA